MTLSHTQPILDFIKKLLGTRIWKNLRLGPNFALVNCGIVWLSLMALHTDTDVVMCFCCRQESPVVRLPTTYQEHTWAEHYVWEHPERSLDSGRNTSSGVKVDFNTMSEGKSLMFLCVYVVLQTRVLRWTTSSNKSRAHQSWMLCLRTSRKMPWPTLRCIFAWTPVEILLFASKQLPHLNMLSLKLYRRGWQHKWNV